MKNDRKYQQRLGLCAVLTLFLSGLGDAVAGTCVIKGQGLVAAYTMAEQEGFRSYATYKLRKHAPRRRSGIYAVPGKLGVKGRTTGNSQSISATFFDSSSPWKKLKRGWKIVAVQYGGSPTAVGNTIRNGTRISLYTRDILRPFKSFIDPAIKCFHAA